MLPTYPNIVAKRQRFNRTLLKARVHGKSPIVGQISQHTIHEGTTSNIARADGSRGVTAIKSHSAETEIPRTVLATIDAEFLAKHIDHLAEQFAEGMTQNILATVSEGAAEVGNVVDGGGRPLSGEVLVEAFEQISLSFNDDGTWESPTIVVSPQQYERLMSLHSETELKEFNRQIDALVEKKRLEHRHRETARILAG